MIPSIDEDVATEEEHYDGFYAVCTNLEDDVATIISIKKTRAHKWRNYAVYGLLTLYTNNTRNISFCP